MSTVKRGSLLLAAVGLLQLAVVTGNTAGQSAGPSKARSTTAAISAKAVKRQAAAMRWLSTKLHRFQVETWHWQDVTGHPRTHRHLRTLASSDVSRLQLQVRWWHHQASLAHEQARHPPHLQAWLCIQSGIKGGRWSRFLKYLGGGHRVGPGEGSWTTDGAIYDGGLQEDLTFQREYAGWLLREKGTANRWNPYEQMWAAEAAFKTRQFGPWPKTALACGL